MVVVSVLHMVGNGTAPDDSTTGPLVYHFPTISGSMYMLLKNSVSSYIHSVVVLFSVHTTKSAYVAYITYVQL